MTLSWATIKDFSQLSSFDKKGLLKAQGTTYKKEMVKVLIGKAFYYSIFIVLPFIFIDIAWYHIIIGWLLKHFLAGLTLALVFQPAHVVPTSEFPLPDSDNNLSGNWAKHQMQTTSDFAANNRVLSWYMGGLNYQIEHHLFPIMSHVHHRAISKIVRTTALEFGLPYHSEPTFTGAIIKHAKTLYKFRK